MKSSILIHSLVVPKTHQVFQHPYRALDVYKERSSHLLVSSIQIKDGCDSGGDSTAAVAGGGGGGSRSRRSGSRSSEAI